MSLFLHPCCSIFVSILEHELTLFQPQPLCTCGVWDSYKILAMHLPCFMTLSTKKAIFPIIYFIIEVFFFKSNVKISHSRKPNTAYHVVS